MSDIRKCPSCGRLQDSEDLCDMNECAECGVPLVDDDFCDAISEILVQLGLTRNDGKSSPKN